MLDAFTKFKSANLKGFLVWLPMVATDSREAAFERTTSDSRISEGWDGSLTIGKAFARTLNLKGTAWDVYLVYEPGTIWSGADPPVPSFWMHQLSGRCGAPKELRLEPARFYQAVERSLSGK